MSYTPCNVSIAGTRCNPNPELVLPRNPNPTLGAPQCRPCQGPTVKAANRKAKEEADALRAFVFSVSEQTEVKFKSDEMRQAKATSTIATASLSAQGVVTPTLAQGEGRSGED